MQISKKNKENVSRKRSTILVTQLLQYYRIMLKYFHLTIVILILSISNKINSEVICVGECGRLTNEFVLAGNAIEPVLNTLFTKQFLYYMGEAGVLQNINSISSGSRYIPDSRVGFGYAMARSKLNVTPLGLQSTELGELPISSIAASASADYGFNLNKLFSNPIMNHFNLSFQGFSYPLRQDFVPFLKIKNTDISGKVENFGVQLRYFPTIQSIDTGLSHGIFFGFGIHRTFQKLVLDSYDRQPIDIRIAGLGKNWIGANQLEYSSEIYSANFDFKYFVSYFGFRIFTGFGVYAAEGRMQMQAVRNSILSSGENKNDFLTYPTFLKIEIQTKYLFYQQNGYVPVGIEYKWGNTNLLLQYLVNRRSESLTLGIQYYF